MSVDCKLDIRCDVRVIEVGRNAEASKQADNNGRESGWANAGFRMMRCGDGGRNIHCSREVTAPAIQLSIRLLRYEGQFMIRASASWVTSIHAAESILQEALRMLLRTGDLNYPGGLCDVETWIFRFSVILSICIHQHPRGDLPCLQPQSAPAIEHETRL